MPNPTPPPPVKPQLYNPNRPMYRPQSRYNRRGRSNRNLCCCCFWSIVALLGIVLLAAIFSAALYMDIPSQSIPSEEVDYYGLQEAIGDEEPNECEEEGVEGLEDDAPLTSHEPPPTSNEQPSTSSKRKRPSPLAAATSAAATDGSSEAQKVDNASSNDVAIAYLKRRINAWKESVLSCELLHMRCCAHILNLIVMDGLKEVHDSIVKIRNAVRFVRSSSSRLQKFKTWEDEKIQSQALVFLDVCTRYKIKYVEFAFARLYDTSTADALSASVRDTLRRLFDHYRLPFGVSEQNTNLASQTSQSRDDNVNVENYDISTVFVEEMSKEDQLESKTEVEIYLAEAREKVSDKFDILNWWKVNSSKYPILALITRDVLAIPMSTVAFESAFSTGGGGGGSCIGSI
ncbi:zinc finger BED domain-containing protein RICESLEEPER 2-like [Senna tora]|uniref:Zinc finger BED domain-containing protein RICESLEEPER 2-like n=1 Tax=Senna tora TaxID=362788 RepID=A0A834TEG5_9FABA|nr:zinc finger BED domain-containing protein RICESLEEPER 2-like [Senna tora]